MVVLIHNPRCTKSRQAKEYLESKGIPFEVREYLKDALSKDELEDIIQKLEIEPIELVRTNEDIWKENYKGKKMSDDQIIQAMVENPKLIQRPIIINGNKAVIGRPTERIEEVL